MADKLLDIKINILQVMALKRYFADAPKLARKAEAKAVRETLKFAKKEIVRLIAKPQGVLNIGKATANRYIKITRRPKQRTPWGKIDIRGEAIRLGLFGARRTKKGVTYAEFRGQSRKLIKGAFIIKKSFGKGKGTFKGVFRRVRTFAEYKQTGRTQFKQYFGPAITDIWKFSPKTAKLINRNVRKELRRQLNINIDKQLNIKHKAG